MKKIRYRTYVDKDFGTTYLINKKTGKMEGRKSIRGRGDGTAVRRVESPKIHRGEILGRTESIPIKGSSARRGTLREL